MKNLIPAIILFSSAAMAKMPESKPETCLSSREYITTLEFLRENKAFGLEEKDCRVVSSKVSEGCTGSSKRFIQVINVLTKAGVPSKLALETAQKFALSSDDTTAAFMTVFKGAFIDSLLDLDVSQALNVAMELSYSYEGNKKLAEKHFNKLVEFCMDKKSLDLPIPECARMSVRVIKSGSAFEFDITKDFIDLFNYLGDQSKSNLPTFEALKVAEHVVKYGPEAKKNFTQAYEYAISKSGMEASQKDAIEFGKTMASRSVKTEEKKN